MRDAIFEIKSTRTFRSDLIKNLKKWEHYAEEIMQHQSNLKQDNIIHFSEHKITNQIKFDHLAHFARLTKVLNELSERLDDEIIETT